jgi:membrane associated rhomboid family serine protease
MLDRGAGKLKRIEGARRLQQLRFAIRMLLNQPVFSLMAALTLALGIGAMSAVFGLIQGVLLTPLLRLLHSSVRIPDLQIKVFAPDHWPC